MKTPSLANKSVATDLHQVNALSLWSKATILTISSLAIIPSINAELIHKRLDSWSKFLVSFVGTSTLYLLLASVV